MRTLLASLGLALMLATSASAAAPAPKKPIHFERMTGRWYEVARTRNDRQKDCHGAYADWVRAGAKVVVTNHCRKGSPTGPDNVFKATARLVDAAKAKISMAFFLGAVNQEYWILDHADDYSWSIMATPGGNYVWVFSRQKTLPAAQRDALIARVRAFGYPVSKLEIGS
jgi:apolipoprotein D and lipocalin family protein